MDVKKGRKWSPVKSFSQINTSNERMRHRDSPAGLWSLRAVSISQRRTGKSRTSRRGVEPHTRRQCQHLEDTGTRSRVTHRLHWLIPLKRNGGHWAAMVEKWEAGVCWNNNWLAQVEKKKKARSLTEPGGKSHIVHWPRTELHWESVWRLQVQLIWVQSLMFTHMLHINCCVPTQKWTFQQDDVQSRSSRSHLVSVNNTMTPMRLCASQPNPVKRTRTKKVADNNWDRVNSQCLKTFPQCCTVPALGNFNTRPDFWPLDCVQGKPSSTLRDPFVKRTCTLPLCVCLIGDTERDVSRPALSFAH